MFDSAPLRSAPEVALIAPGPAALAALRPAGEMLRRFGVGFMERALSARGAKFTQTEHFAAEAVGRGLRVLIVGCPESDLAAALARHTWLPVIRVPLPVGNRRRGLALMTGGRAWPTGNGNGGAGGNAFATVAIGEAGAKNAALLAVSILALTDARLHEAWLAFRAEQTALVMNQGPLAGGATVSP
jgi:5-(carboxyamino)imidazole ribonucleotide mutase